MTNILVCDDDKEIVDAIEIYLQQEGYQIYKAYDCLLYTSIRVTGPYGCNPYLRTDTNP